ncbi:hypothetical protein [Kamptonema sp. UHCC 0994]|uniref:hypothetical protein n=1 Tax=Kamptonema sp. UHCC 0994 TaxID=3031329 RepID=UPI0023B8D729|nr:hypothetical protein [Kamptonema sp. UHCC 0994]MDF0553081.1 hypothetical protein [Kamptonema sp. UHCC 0994]
MLRALIAIFVAFAITFVGTAKPAYAYSDDFSMTSIPPIEIQANGSSSHISDFSNTQIYEGIEQSKIYEGIEQSNPFWDGFFRTVGELAGVATVCFVADAAATTVFPPAAALAPVCAGLAGAVGVKTTLKGVLH